MGLYDEERDSRKPRPTVADIARRKAAQSLRTPEAGVPRSSFTPGDPSGGASKSAEGLPPILGFGQGLLKTILTTGAAGAGALDAVLRNQDPGKIYAAAAGGALKNVAALWGSPELIGDDVIYGEKILKDTLGIEETSFALPARAAIGLPIIGGAAKVISQKDPDAPLVPLGTNTFWGGLALDIATDLLSFAGPAAVATTSVRAAAKAGSAASKAQKMAKSGEVTEAVARTKPELADINNFGPVGAKRVPQNLETVRSQILKTDPAAAEKIIAKQLKLGDYKTVKVDKGRGAVEASKDIVASAADAATKAVKNAYISASTIKFLREYAKRDVTTFGRKLATKVVSEGSQYAVLSGNGLKLAEAATKAEADVIAKQLKKGIELAENFTPAAAIQSSRKITQEAEGSTPAVETLAVPDRNGGEVELQAMVPHQADDGKVYVYDGENVASFKNTQDAEQWISVRTDTPVQQNVEAVISGKSGNYKVTVGKEITRFKTKREATAYAEGVNTGEVPSGGLAMTRGGDPIVDVAPPAPTVKELLKAPAKKEASALKSVLKNLDEIAVKTSGWRAALDSNLKNKVTRILGDEQGKLDRFLVNVPDAVLKQVKAFVDGDIPASTMFESLNGRKTDKFGIQLADLIQTAPITYSKGTVQFGEALKQAKGNALAITKALEGVDGSTLENQLLNYLDETIVKRALSLKSGKIVPAYSAEGKYQALVAAAGEKAANAIRKTGVLDESTPANQKKANSIVADLSDNSDEVDYQSYEDLITGLNRGDDVSQDALEQIFKLIDPDGAIISKLEQASAEPGNAFLRRVFTRGGGVDSIRMAERRLALAGDEEMLLKHANISYSSDIISIIKVLEGSNPSAAQNLQLSQTKQNSAKAFSGYSAAVRQDAADSLGRMFMLPKKEGQKAEGLISFKHSIMEESGAELTLSTLDDYVYMNGKPYADNSRAMLAKQIQQSGEQKVIASLLSKQTARLSKAGKSRTGVEKLDYLQTNLDAANDLAVSLGFRFSRTKNRNDATFQKSYAAELAKAKETKSTPNFSALANKHTVYLPMGSILGVIRKSGGEDSLIKRFFPASVKDKAVNSGDWISLGDAARRVIEMDAAGEPFDVAEIAARINNRFQDRGSVTPRRSEIFKETADELAEVLTNPEVVAELKAVHLDSAASVVKDFVEKSDTFNNDLFDILDEAFVTMHLTNDITEAARMDAVRQYFRKFVIASDIMRLEGGPIAESMFRASAMLFLNGGKAIPPSSLNNSLTKKAQDFWDLLRNEEVKLFREATTRYYRYADLPAAPPGREGMKPPKPAAKDAAQSELSEIESMYGTHMSKLSEVERLDDPALIKEWEKTQAKLQNKLNNARDKAWNNWIEPRYYEDGEWVIAAKYNRDRAVKNAQAAHTMYIAGKRGVEDRAAFLADAKPTIPPHRILTKSEKAKFLKKHRKATTNAQIEKHTSIIDDTSRNIADEVEAGRANVETLPPNEAMTNVTQNMIARGLKEATTIKTRKVASNYKDNLPKNDVEFNETYRPGLRPDTPVSKKDRRLVKMEQFAERWSGSSGRQDVGGILKRAENSTITQTSEFAEALDALARNYGRSVSADDMDIVWASLRDGAPLADDASEAMQGLAKDMDAFINVVFRSHASSVLVTEGIDGQALGEMFTRFGIKADDGFPSPAELNGKTPEELVDSLFQQLPFGKIPEALKGTDKAAAWMQKRDAFTKNTELNPLLAFTRMMEAVQMVKMEKGIALNATSQFGWKAHFNTVEEAIKDGWVSIEAVGKQNIARFLPDAEDGGLFHPAIADQMGSVFREYNNMYDSKTLPTFIQNAMRVMGVIKFTQTTLMPRHHMTNIFGDMTTAMIAGLNKPVDVMDGFRISGRFTQVNAAADWGKWGKDFEAKAARMAGALRDTPGAVMPTMQAGDEIPLVFYKNGKPTTQNISLDKLSQDFADSGIMVPGFVQADIQGFAGDLAYQGATKAQQESLSRTWSTIKRGGRNTMKGFSDFTAAYSNGIRAAHAMKIARSRPWGSYDEMMNAILKDINLYHPTIQSLGSSERKWGRLVFTYYTWLRVAHSAMIDMAVNHTGTMLGVPKLMYNYSVMQGFDPQSAAVPFESQNVLPDYIAYSVYGPNAMNEQGPRTYRPPFLPLDVLDFWKIYVDPSKSIDENLLQMGGQFADVIGGSMNIIGKPIADALFNERAGAATGAEFADAALSNLGFMSLLTGLGVYTPFRYRNPDTTNPLTPADRQRLLENSFSGMRSVDIYRPINVKLGESQYGSRVKAKDEKIEAENAQEIQEFVDQKIAEGLNKEQILELLKQVGVR